MVVVDIVVLLTIVEKLWKDLSNLPCWDKLAAGLFISILVFFLTFLWLCSFFYLSQSLFFFKSWNLFSILAGSLVVINGLPSIFVVPHLFWEFSSFFFSTFEVLNLFIRPPFWALEFWWCLVERQQQHFDRPESKSNCCLDRHTWGWEGGRGVGKHCTELLPGRQHPTPTLSHKDHRPSSFLPKTYSYIFSLLDQICFLISSGLLNELHIEIVLHSTV